MRSITDRRKRVYTGTPESLRARGPRKVEGRHYHMVKPGGRGPEQEYATALPYTAERHSAKQMARALRETRGMISNAARLLGCTQDMVRKYIEKYETVRKALVEARTDTLDKVEDRLITEAIIGEPWAVQFYLKHQGRDRGYGDEKRVDVRVKQDAPALAAMTEIDYDDFNRRTEHALRLVARIERTGEPEPGAAGDHPADATG
jgi:predicted transcriptional regulator